MTEETPPADSFDEQFMQLSASAVSLHRTYTSYVDSGFTREQAFDLVKHVMTLGFEGAVKRQIEEDRLKLAEKFAKEASDKVFGNIREVLTTDLIGNKEPNFTGIEGIVGPIKDPDLDDTIDL